MKINKTYFRIFTLAALLLFETAAFAVTRQEMEQARTIAAKSYLRYANDGSGYLDDLNPTTMEELEGLLKTKEKENIKAFKAIPVPTDYSGWDKEKLVEYWAVTAFKEKGLIEKGRGGRVRARTLINKMTISPPSQSSAQPAPATTASTASADTSAISQTAVPDSIENPDLILDETLPATDDLNLNKADNYTWVYIMVLAILVALVIALVVYGANVLKKKGGPEANNTHEEESETQEHYESVIADKDVEIAMLNKKLENALRQNTELKNRLEAMTSEIDGLRKAAAAAQSNRGPISSPETNSVSKPTLRSIFLGRANSRGIFIRADRTLNIGNSVFVLETGDGFSGSFKVADSQAAWSLALSNPKEFLETACTGHDLFNTSGVSRIVTESAGTAVFEGGCWKVIRKARIRYEY